MKRSLCVTVLAVLTFAASAGDGLWKTFSARQGRSLASENVAGPPTKPALEAVFRADKLAQLEVTIEQAIKDEMIVGAALWVERDGTAYHKAFGRRALQPESEPMTEDTLFDVASITKVMATASAAMLCVERDLLTLDEPVATYLC